jgi:hypothetical protein
VRVVNHIRQVRRMDPKLARARALVVIENNHSDWVTDNFYRALEPLIRDTGDMADIIHDDRVVGVALLDLDHALKEYHRAGGSGTSSGQAARARGEAQSARQQMARAGLLPHAAPGDQYGVQKRGARTTATMKPLMCDLLRSLLHEGRLVVHAQFVAIVSPTPETLETFLDRIATTTAAHDAGLLLARGGDGTAPASVQDMVTRVTPGSELERRFFQDYRERMLAMLAAQFRGFREWHDIVTRRDGRVDESIDLTGKRRDGAHAKKDDLVMAASLLVYSIALVYTLPTLARHREELGME